MPAEYGAKKIGIATCIGLIEESRIFARILRLNGFNVSRDLQTIGVLKSNTDIDALIDRSFKYFDNVPDSYDVSGDDFTEVTDYKNPLLASKSEMQTDTLNAAEKYFDSCCG